MNWNQFVVTEKKEFEQLGNSKLKISDQFCNIGISMQTTELSNFSKQYPPQVKKFGLRRWWKISRR